MKSMLHDLGEDDRVAAAVVELFGQARDVFLPSPLFWAYFLLLLILQSVTIVCFAAGIYKLIVLHRGAAWSYLLGYGVLIPLALLFPFQILEFWNLENHFLKMGLLTVPTAVSFRCLEAMHGTSPACVEDSLVNYLFYSTSVVEFKWDKVTRERVPATNEEVRTNLWRFCTQFCMLSILSSWLISCDFQPFQSCQRELQRALMLPRESCGGQKQARFKALAKLLPRKKPLTTTCSVAPRVFCNATTDLLYPGHLLNNYLAAVFTYLTLSLGLSGASALNHLQGYSAIDCFRNPFFATRSPSDFWANRWNMVAHGMLKRGVYKPLRRNRVTAHAAALLTFVASGLLHDYGWLVVHYRYQFPDGSRPIPFKLTAFFVWCTMVMLLEGPISRYTVWFKTLPRPITSLLVISTVLPVSHWFTGDLLVGGYFRQFAQGLLLILPE